MLNAGSSPAKNTRGDGSTPNVLTVKLGPRTATELGPFTSSSRTCGDSTGMTVWCHLRKCRTVQLVIPIYRVAPWPLLDERVEGFHKGRGSYLDFCASSLVGCSHFPSSFCSKIRAGGPW